MNGEYKVYKRDAKGLLGDLIDNFTGLELTLKWGAVSKWTLDGVTVGTVPLTAGEGVCIYRNGVYFLGGIATEVSVTCSDPDAGVKQWTVTGEDDTAQLSRRMVLADPKTYSFGGDAYDTAEGFADARMIHYLNNAGFEGTTRERQFAEEVFLPAPQQMGTEASSAYRSTALNRVLSEIGTDDSLYPTVTIDERTGQFRVRIPQPRDMTDTVIISPEFGNVGSWKRTEKPPKFNCVWVVSGDYSEGRVWVYAEDAESVSKYGRIETIVTRSDIAPMDPATETTDGTTTETTATDTTTEAADGTTTEEEQGLTVDEVKAVLTAEAQTQLKENGATVSYTIELMETRSLAFMDDWQTGDMVTAVIDGQKFVTQITEVKVTYQKGVETVSPTVGKSERGLFGRVFDLLDGLDRRITQKENE